MFWTSPGTGDWAWTDWPATLIVNDRYFFNVRINRFNDNIEAYSMA